MLKDDYQPMYPNKQEFWDHVRKTSDEVRTWPSWKQNMLGDIHAERNKRQNKDKAGK